MTDDADLYGAAFEAFAREVCEVDPHGRVPACPAWTVHELLAHQVDQLAGAVDGTFPVDDALAALASPDARARTAAGERQQRWIDAGVAGRAGVPVPALLREWSQLVDDAPRPSLGALLPDVAVHLFDLLGVRGRGSHRDDPLVPGALVFWAGMVEARVRLAGLDGIRFETPDGAVLGEAAVGPDAVVRGSGYELLRTIAGRRTRAEAGARLQLPAARPLVGHLALYGWRDAPLDE